MPTSVSRLKSPISSRRAAISFSCPRLYEPCGLNPDVFVALRHVANRPRHRRLDDTVENYNEASGRGTGFKFWEISHRALYFTIGWAVSTWFDRPHHYAAMQQRGMLRDFTGMPPRRSTSALTTTHWPAAPTFRTPAQLSSALSTAAAMEKPPLITK